MKPKTQKKRPTNIAIGYQYAKVSHIPNIIKIAGARVTTTTENSITKIAIIPLTARTIFASSVKLNQHYVNTKVLKSISVTFFSLLFPNNVPKIHLSNVPF